MSAREAERAGVLGRIVAGALRLWEGAELLGLSYRQVKRLLARYRAAGAGVALRPDAAGGALGGGARPRAAHFGELVQLDGSFHDWFEGRGPWPVLLTLVDDATGVTLAQFTEGETTWVAAGLLEAWIRQYGIPQALYTDWHGAYHRTPTAPERTRAELRVVTQFERMCAKLGTRLPAAGSPQAKGRVERNHGTHQDRVVKKLRRAGIADLAAANGFLPRYLAQHNARYAIAPAAAADSHRPWPSRVRREAVFCLEYERVVGRD